MKVFLTGGTGFIGLALAARWAAEGAQVTATAEAPPPDWARATLPTVTFGILDVRDRQAFAETLGAAKPDILVHAAALTPDESRERAGNSGVIFAVNVAGTANALDAAAHAGVARVVAFSSGAAYGRTLDDVEVLDETTTECTPVALYAISKYAAEKVALRLGSLHGLSVVTPRLSAAWGPWEYRTSMRQTLSPGYQIIEAVQAGETPAVAAGTVMPLVFSEDAADMIVRLAMSDAQGPVNIGSTQMIDLADLAQDAASVGTARGLRIGGGERRIDIFTPRRPPMVLDTLANAIGDWPVTRTRDALERCFDWHAGLPPPRPF